MYTNKLHTAFISNVWGFPGRCTGPAQCAMAGMWPSHRQLCTSTADLLTLCVAIPLASKSDHAHRLCTAEDGFIRDDVQVYSSLTCKIGIITVWALIISSNYVSTSFWAQWKAAFYNAAFHWAQKLVFPSIRASSWDGPQYAAECFQNSEHTT